jgi:hypothetical protein
MSFMSFIVQWFPPISRLFKLLHSLFLDTSPEESDATTCFHFQMVDEFPMEYLFLVKRSQNHPDSSTDFNGNICISWSIRYSSLANGHRDGYDVATSPALTVEWVILTAIFETSTRG